MHIAVEEQDGKLLGHLEIGETGQGTIDEVINIYLEKNKNKRIIN